MYFYTLVSCVTCERSFDTRLSFFFFFFFFFIYNTSTTYKMLLNTTYSAYTTYNTVLINFFT